MPRMVPAFALLPSLFAPFPAMSDDGSDLGAQIALQGTSKGVAPCMACHGIDGAGMAAAGYPRIAGLDAGYMMKQLGDFRSGKRSNPSMTPMAKGLTDDEMAAVSAHYASLPVPTGATEPPGKPAVKIASELARWGDWTGRGLPACAQCHAPSGNGVGSNFPGIAGQHASYIKAQLQAWKAGSRSNDPLGLMKAVADRLTEAEVDALAGYYAAQAAKAPTPVGKAQSVLADGGSGASDVYVGEVPDHGAPPAGRSMGTGGYFRPPARDAFPDGVFGDVIREGEAIFRGTNVHPVSSKYVGNGQACENCHLDAGRLADSAPLWAAWVAYPAYRAKNKKVNTYIERIQGCFEYSMNAQASAAGGPPAADSATVVSLVAYSYWLAKGAPTGDDTMSGRGFPGLNETDQGFDPERGAALYAAKCALCHGEGGAGVALPDGRTQFPPLWGAESFNWGAGMHKIDTAAAFIKHNMPLGLAESLSDQESWDLAAFINSHERPQDPRYQGDLAETTKELHGGKFDYYGQREGPDGSLLGERPASK